LDRSSIIAIEGYLMIDDDTNVNLPARTDRGTFAPGVSGHPAGRGNSPGKFSKKFLASLAASWAEHGDAVLQEVRERDAVQYLRICASLIPREVNVYTTDTRPMTQLTQSELEAIVVTDVSQLEHVRAAAEPLIRRVAEFDPLLADDLRKVFDV
jgi:hypothetical protein